MAANPKFPAPGTLLWAVDIELASEIFRSGAASKPNVEYLRYKDIGVAQDGRIADTDGDRHVVKIGQGISLFLERMIPEGMVAMTPEAWKTADKDARTKIQWWGIDQKHPIPSGLQLIYDGDPEGHCTLTVTREMPVKAFLSLVSQVPFSKRDLMLVGPKG